MTNDEEKIRTLIDTWMSASASGDLPQLLTLMDEDVTFLVAGNPTMRGKDAFAEGFQQFLGKIRIEGKSDIQEIKVFGDWAYCSNHLRVTMTPLKDGPPKRRSGNVLSILRKKSDGAWVILRDANMLTEHSPSD